jgi:hypothetical protein
MQDHQSSICAKKKILHKPDLKKVGKFIPKRKIGKGSLANPLRLPKCLRLNKNVAINSCRKKISPALCILLG